MQFECRRCGKEFRTFNNGHVCIAKPEIEVVESRVKIKLLEEDLIEANRLIKIYRDFALQIEASFQAHDNRPSQEYLLVCKNVQYMVKGLKDHLDEK